jgi:hypothetical protein
MKNAAGSHKTKRRGRPPTVHLCDLLEEENLVLSLVGYSNNLYEWCTDFIAILVWFASMFEQDFVFRGHGDCRWSLQPRILRSTSPRLGTFADLVTEERRLVEEVRRNRWIELRDQFSALEYLDFIALLQHKGIPTRLIDVTADPLVATFFAAENLDKDGAVIAILRQVGTLNGRASSQESDPIGFKSSESYTIWTPPAIDLRMVAQRGEFLLVNGAGASVRGPLILKDINLRGKAKYKIDRIAREYFRSDTRGRPVEHPPNMAMFYLPQVVKKEMQDVLRSLGLTRRSLFPDLQGYAALFDLSRQ